MQDHNLVFHKKKYFILYYLSKVLKKARFSAIWNSRIDKTSKIESGSSFSNSIMGRHSFCGYDCEITNTIIGNFTSIANNVVIGGDGLVIYSESGYNQSTMVAMIEEGLSNLILDIDQDGIMDNDDNCIDEYNPNQADTDNDGLGDLCDPCNNLIWTGGDANADLTLDLNDILLVVDIVIGESQSLCGSQSADITQDGVLNVLDVIGLVQLILGGNQQQAIAFLESVLDESTFNKLLP